MDNNIFRKKPVMITFSVLWAAVVAAEIYFRYTGAQMLWLAAAACVWTALMVYVYNKYLDFTGFDALKPAEAALLVGYFIYPRVDWQIINSIISAAILAMVAILAVAYFLNLEKTNGKKAYMCVMLVLAGVLILLSNIGIDIPVAG